MSQERDFPAPVAAAEVAEEFAVHSGELVIASPAVLPLVNPSMLADTLKAIEEL